MNSFYSDLKRGKTGEEKFKHFVEAKGYEVEDLSYNRIYQQKGIDFRIKKGTKELFVEVKTDYRMHKTGNILLELEDGSRTGWARKTEADIVFYINSAAGVAYVLDWSSCRAQISNLRCGRFYVDGGKQMVGAFLPVAELNNLSIIHDVVNV